MTLQRIIGLRVCLSAIFVTILSVTGCSDLRPNDAESIYPKSFPKLIPPSVGLFSLDCPTLTGWYRNKGVRIDSDGSEHEAVLTRDLYDLRDLFSESDEITISIDMKKEFLSEPLQRLTIVSRSGIRWQGQWNRMVCAAGYLKVHRGNVVGVAELMLASIDTTLFLPAVDGSLVGKRNEGKAGLIMIVPFSHMSAGTFYRFPSANREESGNK